MRSHGHGLVWRTCLVVVLASGLGLFAGCASTSLKQAQKADELREYDLAVAQYARAVREHPDNRDAQIGLEKARLRAAESHLLSGRRLFAIGRYEDAAMELQIANDLNPTSPDAERELRTVRAALRAQLTSPREGPTALESLLQRTRDLEPEGYELPTTTLQQQVVTGQQTTAGLLYRTIAKLANLSVTFDSAFREVPAAVTLQSGLTVKQALDAAAVATGTFYQLTGPATIVVVPDTPTKRRDYTDEVARPFVVQNADLKEVQDALRVVADARYISPITGTNMLLVRGPSDLVARIGRLISAFDKARPEIVVAVEVLEISRNELLQYGLQLASPGSTGINGVADVNREGLTLQNLRNLTAADVLMGAVPALYYRLIKTDARTRTLASPHIRVVDGVRAAANFGQDVPVPTTTFSPLATGGTNIQPTTSFAFRTVGVNLNMTLRTHADDDVTIVLNVELSSLGPPGFDGLPTFGRRSVDTTLRLRDGETNVLAGLIREDERTERQSIPGLGSIPILGSIFATNRKTAEQTDVVVMLTPRIVRVLDVSEDDLRPLRIPREGTGSTVMEGPVAPPPPVRGGGPGGGHN